MAETGYYTYSSPVTVLGNRGGTIVRTINYGYIDSVVGNPPLRPRCACPATPGPCDRRSS